MSISITYLDTYFNRISQFHLDSMCYFILKFLITFFLQKLFHQSSQCACKAVLQIYAKKFYKISLYRPLIEIFLFSILPKTCLTYGYGILLEILLGILFSVLNKPNFSKSDLSKLTFNIMLKKTVKLILVYFIINGTVIDLTADRNVFNP